MSDQNLGFRIRHSDDGFYGVENDDAVFLREATPEEAAMWERLQAADDVIRAARYWSDKPGHVGAIDRLIVAVEDYDAAFRAAGPRETT